MEQAILSKEVDLEITLLLISPYGPTVGVVHLLFLMARDKE